MSTTQEDQKLLSFTIVGGGIAGLATAIALRAPNHNVTVLEQSSLNREIGATISLQPNASKIIEKQWGMAEALKDVGAMRDEAFQIFSTDGKLQRRIPLLTKTEYGASRQMYHRMDLHDTLKHFATRPDAYGRPAEIKVSSCVTACDPDVGTVTLKDGSIVQSDVIVAADGIKSALRQYVLGEEVHAEPTGLSAYRLVVPTSDLEKDEGFRKVIDPRESSTAMVMAHDRRVIMGPARAGSIYSLVALVPDQRTNVDDGNSWTSKGDLQTLLEEYKDFPEWVKAPFRLCKEEIGLWQLRDTKPLKTWHRGRVILIGDAAHAMLPTQGQGASQAIEDAEAVGAYFSDADGESSLEDIQSRLQAIFDARYERATTIQQYSRDAARPATEKGETLIKMNPAEFMDYNCLYNGAKDWVSRRKAAQAEPNPTTLHSGMTALKVS